MADFRKMFYALAIVALIACFTVPATAQSLACLDLHATNQVIRVEGWSELAGDIVLGCSGSGLSTAPGNPVAAADITVTIPQTQIASKVLNPAATSGILSEATLIIDDLKDPSSNAISNYAGSRQHRICNDSLNGTPGVCQILAPASPNLTYLGDASHPNIFVGRPNGASAVVFPGVPLDPPGTNYTRTLRITNIRINGTVFDPTNPFAQVVAIITFQGPAAVGLNSVQTTIATVQKGMGATKITSDNTFLQCDYPLNTLAKADQPPTGPAIVESHGFTTNLTSTAGCPAGTTAFPCVVINTSSGQLVHPVLAVTEGFQTAWKPRDMGQLLGSSGVVVCGSTNGSPCNGGGDNMDLNATSYTTYNGTVTNPTDIPMNNPTVRFFTEGGFTENASTGLFTNGATGTTAVTIAYDETATTYPNGATGGGAGTADWGTRIQFTISSIPNGTTLALPTVVQLLNGSTVSGVMVMTTTSTANGKGAYTPVVPSSALTSLQNSGYFDLTGPGPVSVTYEVLFSDPFSTETAKIYPVLYFPPLSLPTSVSNDLPQANVGVQVTNATFAPWYAATGNQSTSPLGQVDGTPRFIQTTGGPTTLLTIGRCTCSLLFPWVVSDANYVTGIAVANTSKDPTNGLTPPVIGYTAVQSAGKVQLYLFGTILGVTAQTNTSIAAVYGATAANPTGDATAKAGSYATFIVNTGFTGYGITQANFQYCHGLAFLFNATGAVPPVSYLGLVMDPGGLTRTTQPLGDSEGN